MLAITAVLSPVILQSLSDILQKKGITSRVVDKLLSGSFLKSDDRMQIYIYLLRILSANPLNFLVGIGLCGDRYYLPFQFTGMDATYAHNLFMEILLDFGVFLGGTLIIGLLYLIINNFLQETSNDKKILFSIFFFVSFVQLMISRSWLTEANLFAFVAMLLTYSSAGHIKLKYIKIKFST